MNLKKLLTNRNFPVIPRVLFSKRTSIGDWSLNLYWLVFGLKIDTSWDLGITIGFGSGYNYNYLISVDFLYIRLSLFKIPIKITQWFGELDRNKRTYLDWPPFATKL